MSVSRHHHLLLRKPSTIKSFSTSTSNPTHHNNHQNSHQFLQPHNYINSWKPTNSPKEAESRLAFLRRDYAKRVRQVRKDYIEEMELMRLDKQRKDDAKREALRLDNEERKKAKALQKAAKAKERELTLKEFQQMLLKERTEKLEYWRTREKNIEEKKKEKNELLRRQSSMWIAEPELEKKILEVIVDTTSL